MGITELKGAFRVTATNIDMLVTSLQSELQTAIVQGDFTSEPKEKEAVELALNSLGTTATVEGLKEDIRVYMEATIARSRIRAAPGPRRVVMLITEDHQFFKIFARSPIAEKILLSRVDAVLGRNGASIEHSPDLRIVLAGEVVPGM